MKGRILLAFVTMMLTGIAQADVSPKQQPEVAHLLQFVKNSPCKVNRNGSFHHGQDAATHILKKYDYFRKKIKTTEQFIEYSASKSTMSRKDYTVRCNGAEEIRTRDWLLRELETYRSNTTRR
ncbi:MAG: hypothetical protein D3925_01525 [Candidatus Electrothrix sp. AR5]|nr:hypothetical protein [Candidatus Electrothrix sp. AR5]